MALELKPEQEKALLAVLDRELALPKLIADREDAEAALVAAQAARQAEVTQAEVASQALVGDINRRHAPALIAAMAALEAAKQAEDAVKLGAVEVKP